MSAEPSDVRPASEEDVGVADGWATAALFAFALVVGAYFTFRFGGRWSESDTAAIGASIRAIQDFRTTLPFADYVYPNGYAFGTISVFVLAFTGLDVPTLLQSIYPLVSASLVLIAWPLYRDLTGSSRGATLATLLLFIQPEFLFVILRGSHERVLRALVMLSLWLLVRSVRHADTPRTYAAYAGLFYLAAYGIIATNSLFGTSYVWALVVAFIGSWCSSYLGPRLYAVSSMMRRRLVYVPLVCLVFAVVFNGYIYPPAGESISQLPDIADRLRQIFLTTAPEGGQASGNVTAYDPYAAVVDQWIDVRVYFLVSIGTYLLMMGSAFAWIRLGLRWLAGVGTSPTIGQWLLWLFYGAFAMQGALSVVADRSGALGGNLQYRSFPSFVLVAAPVLASVLAEWRPRPQLRPLAAGGLGVLTLLGIAKATNEPMISNKWTFYQPSEVAAASFATRTVKDGVYWADFDERLSTMQFLLSGKATAGQGGPITPNMRAFVVTDVIRLRAARLNRPLPPVAGELRVYDNGEAQIYRLRPRTPYQD